MWNFWSVCSCQWHRAIAGALLQGRCQFILLSTFKININEIFWPAVNVPMFIYKYSGKFVSLYRCAWQNTAQCCDIPRGRSWYFEHMPSWHTKYPLSIKIGQPSCCAKSEAVSQVLHGPPGPTCYMSSGASRFVSMHTHILIFNRYPNMLQVMSNNPRILFEHT